MLYFAFILLFLLFWSLFAAVLPRILRGLHALANRGAGMSMRYGVVQRVVHHASRFRDYLPVILIVIAGALLAAWAGEGFLDLAEMVHTKNTSLQKIDVRDQKRKQGRTLKITRRTQARAIKACSAYPR